MKSAGQPLSALPRYRATSLVLIGAILGSQFIVRLLNSPDWLGALIALYFYILLVVITYRRLRNAALSGGWIVLMLISLNLGPEWSGVHLSNLVSLIPVMLGWIVPANGGANPRQFPVQRHQYR